MPSSTYRLHERNTRFLLAVPSAMEAAPYVLRTGKPVMALGGFSGADAILTPTSLAALVRQGTVRYFLLPGRVNARSLASFFAARGGGTTARNGAFSFGKGQRGGASSGRNTPGELRRSDGIARGGFGFWGGEGQSAVTQWVTRHCSTVRPSLWRSTSIKNGAVFHVKNAPKVLQAYFAENLDPKQSWINVFEGVADHGLVNEKTRSVVNFKNPKELTLRLPTLRPDKYYFVWYTYSEDDGHFAAGVVYFSVVK